MSEKTEAVKYLRQNRHSVVGKWILDRRLGNPSMNGILQAMDIPYDTIAAHMKQDESMDIMCHIDLTESHFKIRSYYIQDVHNEPRVEIIPLGKEVKEGPKTTLVTSDVSNKIVMKRKMSTICGFAEYLDIKEIVHRNCVSLPDDFSESNEYFMKQTVTVKNHESGKEHTSIRYYLPVDI